MSLVEVKEESYNRICQACLSTNRRLTPLDNYELFYCLIGQIEDMTLLNIHLCWECTALFRRLQNFQRRIQQAQYILSLSGSKEISTETLSTLSSYHIDKYDYTIEENEQKPESHELLVFEDTKLEICEKIKEETHSEDNDLYDNEVDDLYDNEVNDPDYVDNDEVKVKKETKKYKKYDNKVREKIKVIKIDNKLDFNNVEKYFEKVHLSEKDVEEMLKKRTDDSDAHARPHKCDLCGFRFGTVSVLTYHKKFGHKKVKTKCHMCRVRFDNALELQLHCWRAHAVQRCRVCGEVVARNYERARHLEAHRLRYRCSWCQHDFNSFQDYLQHKYVLHTEYKCDHCGRSFKSKVSLEKHILKTHLPNKCESCSAMFPSSHQLARHRSKRHPRESELGDPNAYCVECDQRFPTMRRYRHHLLTSTKHRPSKPKENIPCPVCGKIFARRQYMENHCSLYHAKDSKHRCELCNKFYFSRYSLRVHRMYVHEKKQLPKNKMCNVCGRGFSANKILTNHMRTHTGERPFACTHCPAAFAQRVALKSHLRSIHKEK